MITEIEPNEVILACRETVGLPRDEPALDDALLAGLLRRCAGMLCPCSAATLRSALVAGLNHLHEDMDALSNRIDTLIDELIFYGDLLELSDVTIDSSDVKGTWVFAAPPSFVVRSSGSIFLVGIVPDQDAFLPESIAARVRHEGCVRLLTPNRKEQLDSALTELGVNQLSENVWLKEPNEETAESLFGRNERMLKAKSDCGTINDLQILDSDKPVTHYRRRWTSPKDQTGTFVARRPQEFGAPIWCFVQLEEGVPQRLIDLPLSKFRWRGCDAAWHLQMAIDYRRGQPQLYRKRETETGIRFDFFSPLPQWFERRLLIFGCSLPRERCLVSYELKPKEAEDEERSMRRKLWLVPVENHSGDKV